MPSAGGASSTPIPVSGGAAPTPGAGGTTTVPPTVGTVAITRAEWDASKQTLRLEGTSSNSTATLTAEFAGRTEPLTNAAGRFRAELTAVAANPITVTVRSSTGAQATANVVAK